MKSKKFLIAISLVLSMFLVLSMSFSLFSCGENDELLERIEELSTKIQAQEKSVEGLQDENQALKEANGSLQQKIETLQDENQDLTERLTEIEWTYNAPYGNIYTLEKYYELGRIDKQILMNIAYHLNGGKEKNEEIMADFEPTPLETLSAEMERRIKETFAYWGRVFGEERNQPITWESYWLLDYLGCYILDDYRVYVVNIEAPYTPGAGDAMYDDYIDGVCFTLGTSAEYISVYVERRTEQ